MQEKLEKYFSYNITNSWLLPTNLKTWSRLKAGTMRQQNNIFEKFGYKNPIYLFFNGLLLGLNLLLICTPANDCSKYI